MTKATTRTPLFRHAAITFAAGLGLIAIAAPAQALTPDQNKTVVAKGFDAWAAGTGSPFDLLTEDARWTIEGRSAAAGAYAGKAALIDRVIRPFNARMVAGIKPTIRSITAEGDRVVILFDAGGMARDSKPYANSYAWFFTMRDGRVFQASAFFDAIAFDDLWTRVAPAD